MTRRTTLSAGQLVLLSSVLALLPAVIFGAFTLYSLVVRDQSAQRQQLLEASRALSVGIDHEIDTLRQISNVLARSRLLALDRMAAFDGLARDAASVGRYDVALVDRSGQQLVNTRLDPAQPLPKTTNMGLISKVFVSGKTMVSDLVVRTSDRSRTIAIMTPVIAQGETPYVLIVTPHLDTIAAVFDRLALRKGWVAAIDDPSGTIVARSIDADKHVGEKARLVITNEAGVVKFSDIEGRPSYMAYHVSAESGFRAVVWAPERIFYESTNALFSSFATIAVLALVVAIAAGIAAARVVGTPILDLVETAGRLGEGAQVMHTHSIMREANVVGDALEQASSTIAAREAALRKETAKTVALAREVAHRTKNVMAVVAAIARQSIRSARNQQDFATIFEGRLGGLARSLDLLVETDWEGVALADLVRQQVSSFADEMKFEASGPPILLAPPAVQNIGMALHELATNAVKYGALSTPAGRVLVSWSSEGERFRLVWAERDGPPVAEPQHKGFGRSVIEVIAASGLGGTAFLTFAPDGVVWTLEAPLASLSGAPQGMSK